MNILQKMTAILSYNQLVIRFIEVSLDFYSQESYIDIMIHHKIG